MEVVKSYRIPIEAPRDLIEEYLRIKRRALEHTLLGVKLSEKAHLDFSREERRELRNSLLVNWRFSKHYVDSAINSVIGLVKAWITLYNKGKAKRFPEITRRTVYIKNTLFSFRNGVLKISIEPGKRYLIVELGRYPWIPNDFDNLGGLILTEKGLIITVKKSVKPRAERLSSFDVNLTNITAIIDGRIERYDMKGLYHIHRVYEAKRRRIQKLAKFKPKTSKKLLRRHSRRERDRARDFMHKLTAKIANRLKQANSGAIMERLKGIKQRILISSRKQNRKLSKWSARTFQSMLEYKLMWAGLPVKYVDPKGSSKTCPLCSGYLVAYGGRLMRCGKCVLVMDRDVVAALNLQMRGGEFTQSALHEVLEREGLCIST